MIAESTFLPHDKAVHLYLSRAHVVDGNGTVLKGGVIQNSRFNARVERG